MGQTDVLNMTDFDPRDLLPPRSTFEYILYEIFVPIVFALITLLGIVGNSLVAVVIITKSHMRSPTNLLLLNLAFADILFVLVCPPLTAYQIVTQTWPFGDAACKIMHYVINVSAYVTIYTLVSIAILRFLKIVHPQRTVTLQASSYTFVLMALLWVVILVANIPSVWVFSAHYLLPEGYEQYSVMECSPDSVEFGQLYYLTFFAFGYLLPLFSIAGLSVGILRHIHKHRTRVNSHRSQTDMNGRRQKQAKFVLVGVVTTFALLWLPIHILLIVSYSFPKFDNLIGGYAISVISQCLAYSNSCVNPFIYNFASQDFRESFQGVVGCQNRHSLRADPNFPRSRNLQATVNETQLVEKSPSKRNGVSKFELQPLNAVSADVITTVNTDQTELFV